MADWRRVLSQITTSAEAHFDTLKRRLDQRLGDGPLQVVAYHGYGTPHLLYLKGRVVEDCGVRPARDNDSVWRNLLNMYRRFETDEIPGARVLARFQDVEQVATTNEEGFFELRIAPAGPLPAGRLWHEVELALLEPLRKDHPAPRSSGRVLVPPPDAQFGVISDIDDTVVRTDVTNMLLMARTVFLRNARTRLPFPGVAALYRALERGTAGRAVNPLFYVSSSAWNLYDMLLDFLAFQGIPGGAMLLRDWGTSKSEFLPTQNRGHKLDAIRRILDQFPHLPFLLIGDSGQEDPEIYHEVLQLYPGRIYAIYIRSVSREPRRVAALRALAEQVVATGKALILADDSLAMAHHAAEQGWIDPATLAEVAADKAADEAPPDTLETMLGETEPAQAPTVVVAEAADVGDIKPASGDQGTQDADAGERGS